MNFVFEPAPTVAVPVVGTSAQFPVHRIDGVGRNCLDHAQEMDDSWREPLSFSVRPVDMVLHLGAVLPGDTLKGSNSGLSDIALKVI